VGIAAPDQVNRAVYWTQFPAHALSGTDWSDHANAHASIMRLFPARLDGPPQERRSTAGVLYRVDAHPDQCPTVLIQSLVSPELTPAPAQTLTVPSRAWDMPAGTPVAFRVTVCPIRRHNPPKGHPGKERTTPVPDDELDTWVTSKISPAFTDVKILNTMTHATLARPGQGRACPPRVALATVDGVAVITDPDTHTLLRVQGVGRAKAYGAGLLTTRPLT